MRDPNNYTVFLKAHALARRIASISAQASMRKTPGLSQQLRRASTSVPANIAEGCGHSSQREFARFLQLALASASEVAYHLTLANDINALTAKGCVELRAANSAIRRMLASLLRRVRGDLTDDDSVAAMQRRRTPRPPPPSAQSESNLTRQLVPANEIESHD